MADTGHRLSQIGTQGWRKENASRKAAKIICSTTRFGNRAPKLRRALREYMEHYHLERNHQGLDNNLIASALAQCSKTERIDCRSRLGGILRFYERAVA